MPDLRRSREDKRNTREVKKAVEDLSAHAHLVDAKRLKGKIKVVTREDIMRIVHNVIDSYGKLGHGDLLAKISRYELDIRALEGSVENMQAALQAAEEDARLAREGAASSQKNEDLEQRMGMLEAELESERSKSMTRDAETDNLRKRLSEAAKTLSAARETIEARDRRVTELEALASQEAGKAKIAELLRKMAEMETMYKAKIKTLLEYIWELQIGLEFADLPEKIAAADFSAPIRDASALMAKADRTLRARASSGERAANDALKLASSAFAVLRKRFEQIKLSFAKADALAVEMEDGKGSVAVVNEIEVIFARCRWALEDLNTDRILLNAFCKALGAGE
jgi:multidrug efflux pump subunit AcrA (membrane-fusion protein)